ncbi:MAG: helix-turn-helix domain-containing protein [Bacteroides sp.]|nr:helix-turn-helix domain-containing protein [Bacteroides sp.]
MYDFGLTLKNLRRKKGLTQKKLASLLEVSEGTVSRYESNQVYPPFETVRAIAAILGTSADELYGMEKRFTVSAAGLSDGQKKILSDLADTFSAMNGSSPLRIPEERYNLLGHIAAELLKGSVK